LPTTAGVGVGDVTALEADIDTDAIGAEDAIGGVVGFTDPDTETDTDAEPPLPLPIPPKSSPRVNCR
jgi:hypothetical protein